MPKKAALEIIVSDLRMPILSEQGPYRLIWWAYRFCWSDRASKCGLISSLTTVGGLSARYDCFALASIACIGWVERVRGLIKWCCS